MVNEKLTKKRSIQVKVIFG